MLHTLQERVESVCTLEVDGNNVHEVELFLISGIFFTDIPQAVKRRYGQTLSVWDSHQLVKVYGNMRTLEETILLLRQMYEVHAISIYSPDVQLKDLDLNLKLSLWNSVKNRMGLVDILSVNHIGRFSSEMEAYIDLIETPFDATSNHLFMSINVKPKAFFKISFFGQLKDSLSPELFIPKNNPVPTSCKTCGALLHGRKCDYCGAEY